MELTNSHIGVGKKTVRDINYCVGFGCKWPSDEADPAEGNKLT